MRSYTASSISDALWLRLESAHLSTPAVMQLVKKPENVLSVSVNPSTALLGRTVGSAHHAVKGVGFNLLVMPIFMSVPNTIQNHAMDFLREHGGYSRSQGSAS